jgi:Domain of unknown function (DUF4440)
MPNRTIALAALLILASGCAAAPKAVAAPASPGEVELAEVKRLERAMWQAWKDRDLATIRGRTANDYKTVTEEGPEKAGGFDDLVKSFDRFQVRGFEIDKMVAQPVGPDTVVVSYNAHIDASYSGQDISRDLAEAAVWVKREGRWVNVFLHEITRPKALTK